MTMMPLLIPLVLSLVFVLLFLFDGADEEVKQ